MNGYIQHRAHAHAVRDRGRQDDHPLNCDGQGVWRTLIVMTGLLLSSPGLVHAQDGIPNPLSTGFIRTFDKNYDHQRAFTGKILFDDSGRIECPNNVYDRIDSVAEAGAFRITSDGMTADSLTFDYSAFFPPVSYLNFYPLWTVLRGKSSGYVAYISRRYTPIFVALNAIHQSKTFRRYPFNQGVYVDYSAYQATEDSGYIFTAMSLGGTALLLKQDAECDSLWVATYQPDNLPNQEYQFRPYDVRELSGGGYVIVGASVWMGTGVGVPYYRGLLIRADRDGKEVWRTYMYAGLTREAILRSVTQAPDGKILAAGVHQVMQPFDTTNPYLICVDSTNGAVLWTKRYGYDFYPKSTLGLRDIDYFSTVRLTRDGGIALAGCIQSPDSSAQALFVKTDINGNELWRRTYSLGRETRIDGMEQAPDGGFVMVGYATNQKLRDSLAGVSFIMKTDSLANYPTSIDAPHPAPDDLALSQNYPNPVGPGVARTAIIWSAPSPGPARLVVSDALGRTIRIIEHPASSVPGVHTEVLDTRDLPSGLYLYRLVAGGRAISRTMIVAR
jgi:hypothetical protein